MIRKYGLLQYDSYGQVSQSYIRRQILALPPVLLEKVPSEVGTSRRLHEMAHFLEIIRNLQSRLNSKFKRPGQRLV